MAPPPQKIEKCLFSKNIQYFFEPYTVINIFTISQFYPNNSRTASTTRRTGMS